MALIEIVNGVRVHRTPGKWPFTRMEVGETILCTQPGAGPAAHAAGNRKGMRFMVRKTPEGHMVTRLPDNTPVRAGRRANNQGRERRFWPFYELSAGQMWVCTESASIPSAQAAVARANRAAGKQVYATRASTVDSTYVKLAVLRLP